MKTPKDFIKDKEEEFKEKFTSKPSGRWWTPEYGKDTPSPKDIRTFLHQALQEAMVMGVESVKVKKVNMRGYSPDGATVDNLKYMDSEIVGYNQAVSDLETKKAEVIKEIGEV